MEWFSLGHSINADHIVYKAYTGIAKVPILIFLLKILQILTIRCSRVQDSKSLVLEMKRILYQAWRNLLFALLLHNFDEGDMDVRQGQIINFKYVVKNY